MVFRRSSNCPRYLRCRQRSTKGPGRECACRQETMAHRLRRCAVPGPPQWQFSLRPARRSGPDYSWCGGRESGPRAPTRSRVQLSGSSELSTAACVRSRLNSASKELSLGRLDATFSDEARASSSRMAESRSPRSCTGSRPQNTSLRAKDQAAGARYRCVYGPTARLPRLRKPKRACTRGSVGDRPMSTLSPGWWYDPRSACGSIRPPRETEENGWPGFYLPGAIPAVKCSVSINGLPNWLAS